MDELAKALGRAFVARPRRVVLRRSVLWTAHPEDGGDPIYLRNIGNARWIVDCGWVWPDGQPVAYIRREVMVNDEAVRTTEYNPGDTF